MSNTQIKPAKRPVLVDGIASNSNPSARASRKGRYPTFRNDHYLRRFLGQSAGYLGLAQQ